MPPTTTSTRSSTAATKRGSCAWGASVVARHMPRAANLITAGKIDQPLDALTTGGFALAAWG